MHGFFAYRAAGLGVLVVGVALGTHIGSVEPPGCSAFHQTEAVEALQGCETIDLSQTSQGHMATQQEAARYASVVSQWNVEEQMTPNMLESQDQSPRYAIQESIPTQTDPQHLTSPPLSWFGVLQPPEENLDQLANAGIGVASFEIAWDRYEPLPGKFDTAYLEEIRARYRELRSFGFELILDPGLQYPPAWVFDLDGETRFVNQYGDRFEGGTGNDVPDAVFNSDVREAQKNYLHRVARDLEDLEMFAVRVGGLGYGELRFPDPAFEGHNNSYWGFGQSAQEKCPVPGWQPGDPGSAEAEVFIDWYLQSLADYGYWLAQTVRFEFGPHPQLHVLLPSWGVRPGEVAEAIHSQLDGSSRGERRQTLNQGVDWERQLNILNNVSGVVASTTWLDAPSQGIDDGYQSPVAYLSGLASALRIPVVGENTGSNTEEEMTRAVQHSKTYGLAGMLWMRAPDFDVPGLASLLSYQLQIEESIGAQDARATTSVIGGIRSGSPTTSYQQ